MFSAIKLNKKITATLLIIAAITTLNAGSFYLGYQSGSKTPKTIVLENLINAENLQAQEADFGIFWETWDLLKKEHLKGASVSDQDFLYGAVRGLVGSLKDPHTVFFPPEDSKKFEEDVNGSFGGIGAEIGIKNSQLIIIAPLKGTPAENAGLKPDDKILAIDDKSTEGLDVSEAVKKIRGEVGTEVTLSIFREGWSVPRDIKIKRTVITIPTIETKIIEKSDETASDNQGLFTKNGKEIAHVALFSFNQNAPLAFYKEALRVLIGRADGLVLDLRNNPGGFLEVAINLAGWFLGKGELVVTEKFRSGQEIAFRTAGNGALKDLPTIVLVNKGSASASEILAGALRAHGIKLVGEKTFGKGTVQELRELSDGSKIKLTIANWVLPDGSIIDEKGITPDYEVKITEEDLKNKKDPQLDKAIEVLLGEIK